MNSPASRPIATKLIQTIFVWATACALLICVAQAAYSYLHVQEEFEAEVGKIGDTNVPLLSVSVWDIEPDAIRRQIDAISLRPQIGFVRLTVATGQVFEAGDARLKQVKSVRRFDIPPPGRSQGSIGSLDIYENPTAFYRELAMTVGFAVVGYGILTALICALIVYVLKRELELPLRRIADFATSLTPERLTTPLILDRAPEHRRDEIDLVVEGFQVLQEGINDHIENLDRLVAQRTAELESAMESIQRLSLLDPLTGFYNRRAFNDRIMLEIERAGRYARPLSLVFGDIDHFKRINDTHGHLVGDQVIQAIAACFRRSLRSEVDWVARYGGEEFVIVLPETDAQSALAGTERLRAEVEQMIVPEFPALRVTASFGVVQYAAGETGQGVVARADALLYRAKQAGRNCVFAESGQ